MCKKNALLIVLLWMSLGKVLLADECPSTVNFVYHRGLGWSLPSSFSKSWVISDQKLTEQVVTDPLTTILRMEVSCFVNCSQVSCKYYKQDDLSHPIMVLTNTNTSNVDWDSIANYYKVDNGRASYYKSCQMVGTIPSLCPWRWRS